MKKLTIIIISLTIFLLLAFRTLFTYFDGVKDEKLSYVHKLNFKFSTKIDSVGRLNRRNVGRIFFHSVIGTFEESVEDKLKDELKYSGELRFIFRNENTIAMSINTKTADKYQTGDSIVVDTNNNKITFHRGAKVISENKVTEALACRPF